MNTSINQNFDIKKYEVLVYALYIIAAIFLVAGIIFPVKMINELGNAINRNPEMLFFPLYIGLLLIAFAGLSFATAVILKQPSNETDWIVKTLNAIGTILIIIGVFGFFVASSDDLGIKELRNAGLIGGVLILLFHLKIGLLCLGLASLHNKYNSEMTIKAAKTEGSNKHVYCTSCGKQVIIEPGDKMCYHCGEKL